MPHAGVIKGWYLGDCFLPFEIKEETHHMGPTLFTHVFKTDSQLLCRKLAEESAKTSHRLGCAHCMPNDKLVSKIQKDQLKL